MPARNSNLNTKNKTEKKTAKVKRREIVKKNNYIETSSDKLGKNADEKTRTWLRNGNV